MRPLMPPVQTPDNLFHDGNPLTGELGTIVDAEHLNNEQAAIRDTQSELIAILTAAAMEPESTAGQLLVALNKLYAPLNDTLGALSSLVGGANKLPYFTASNAAALTALSSIGRNIIGKAKVADVLTYLGLGEIATVADIQAGTASKLVDAEGLKKYLPTKVMQVSGFIRIPDVPGGTIIQWGQVTGTINEGTKNVVLPTPFPNSGRFAIAIPLNLAGDNTCDIFAQLQSASLTGINFFFSWVSSSTPANGFQWFAIGY